MKLERSTMSRLDDSELKELDTLSEQMTTMSTFIGFTQNPTNIDWSAYHDSFAAMMKQHELSKPYVLRALEACHRAALFFDDDEAVCDSMQPGSIIGGALHLAVSSDELVTVLTTKTEAIITSLLKAHVKDKSSNGKPVRDGSLTAGLVERLNIYKGFAASTGSPIGQCLDPIETVVVLVDPKRAQVADLALAAELMDNGKNDMSNALLGERLFIQEE